MISKQNWKFCFQTPETVWTVFHVTSVLKQAEFVDLGHVWVCFAWHSFDLWMQWWRWFGEVFPSSCSDSTPAVSPAIGLQPRLLHTEISCRWSHHFWYWSSICPHDFSQNGKAILIIPSGRLCFFGCSFNCTSIFFEQRRVCPHSSCCYVRPTFVVIPSVTLSLTKSVKFSGGN